MTNPDHSSRWASFQRANRFRRAIRNFGTRLVSQEDMTSLFAEAVFAPSSGNLQPYELHWIREPILKAGVAAACNGQRAAATATELVVFVANPAIGRQTAQAQLAYMEASPMPDKSKIYYRQQIRKFQKILGLGSSALWSPLLFLAALLRPGLSLLPIGHIGSRHWAARNAVFAAQTLILGAAAKGIDSCPMEGFSASKLIKLLGLPRGSVIPIVVALGYRAEDARLEQQWRRPVNEAVVSH